MIQIINTGKKKGKKTHYEIVINNVTEGEFWHNRLEGLGVCLLEASKSVERDKYLKIKELLNKRSD